MTDKPLAAKLAELGCLCGITSGYWDNFGRRHRTSQATYKALLSAMGVPWEDPEQLDWEIARRRLGPWDRLLEPVQVLVYTPTPAAPRPLEVQGEIIGGPGGRVAWEASLQPAPKAFHPVPEGFRFALEVFLPQELELGYYDLTLTVRGGGRQEGGKSRLIVAPRQAYVPDWLAVGRRVWGFNLPLYALRGEADRGVGDFGDLRTMIRWAGSLGAAFVGVNPLHALAARPGSDPSPYAPASRMFLNFLYLNLEMVPELAACREAQELAGCHPRLAQAPLISYEEVYRLKLQGLRFLYRTFTEMHGTPEAPRTPRGREFAHFLEQKGETLARFGQFFALADFLRQSDWRRWPLEYRHPGSPAVESFSREHPEDIRFYQYGQWLAADQLHQVCDQARNAGLPFTLYQDLALGANPGGFDTWAHQEICAQGPAIGAPPDAFNPKGQNWGLPPMIPERLRESGYQLFIDTLRANCPPGGMLRLDHAMGLFRLLWIPHGEEAAQGAYVHYPSRDLLAILALESVQRRTLIIGEDLGTVPPRIRRELHQARVYSYRVFYFERDRDHHFLPPEAYPALAMAAVTTHDLPTLQGFWQGKDLALKRALNLYPQPHLAEEDAATREQDRRLLLEALASRGLLPEGTPPESYLHSSCPRELREAVLEYLAQGGAGLLEVRLEEIFGVAEQQNLPGTRKEHPNWRRRLPLTLARMEQDQEPAHLAARLNRYRSRSNLEGKD
jgi:4-alpha-glucanotransferase